MPALITPFDKSGALDLDAHAHNLGRLTELGLGGFLVAGSTGEGSLLDPGERLALTKVARDTLGAGPTIVVGVWAESVRQAMVQIDEAAEGGADSVLVVTPTTLARRSVPAQIAFFTAVAKASVLPVLLYSVPPNTGYALDLDATIKLSNFRNIVGMKDSGGDAVRIGQIIAGAPDDFVLFNGATRSLALAIASGAHGGITASGNFMPTQVADLIATSRKSTARGVAMQPSVTALASAVESYGVPGVKAGAELGIGLRAGSPRAPFSPVSKSVRNTLAASFQ
jgi:dihydrodipicolinate synthase/N-acetylneuraminate lyase